MTGGGKESNWAMSLSEGWHRLSLSAPERWPASSIKLSRPESERKTKRDYSLFNLSRSLSLEKMYSPIMRICMGNVDRPTFSRQSEVGNKSFRSKSHKNCRYKIGPFYTTLIWILKVRCNHRLVLNMCYLA